MKKFEDRNSIIIIGSIPPPIGGVSVHVKRLIDSLNSSFTIPWLFFNLKKEERFRLIPLFIRFKYFHLHTSSPYFRFIFISLSKLFGKKTILTIHGNLGRFGILGNIFDRIAVKYATIPILLNEDSYIIGKKINSNSKLISAFIAPAKTELLNSDLVEDIVKLKKDHLVFCTNAYNVSFDKNGHEIYGISELIDLLQSIKNCKLIISDPSGNYKKFVGSRGRDFINPPIWINYPHDFIEVLKLSNGFIRNTITDGDSLSVREAIYLGLPVYASNAVQRPPECNTYSDVQELKILLESYNLLPSRIPTNSDASSQLISLYKEIVA